MESPQEVETEKSFSILSDKNKEYILIIKLDHSYLEISIKTIKEIPNISYKKKYNLEELISINNYFKICGTIEQAYQVINEKLNTKKYELKELNNGISLIIISDIQLCGNCNLVIPLVQKTEKEDINEIYNLIKKLNSENIKLINEKKSMEEKFINEINILKEELNKIKKENELIKNNTEKNFNNVKSLVDQYKKDFDNMKQSGFPSCYENPKNKCGNSTVQFFQTRESYEGSEQSWAHYIILNHGDGNGYYQVVIRFPFWNGDVQIGHRENGSWKGWKSIGTTY